MTGDMERRRRGRARGAALPPPPSPRALPPFAAGDTQAGELVAIEAAAASVLEDIGIACRLPDAFVARANETGLAATAEGVKFPRQTLRGLLAMAPRVFTHVAREPGRSREISAACSMLGPALAAAHVWHGAERKPLAAADARALAAIAEQSAALDYGAGVLHLSAADVSAADRLTAFVGSGSKPLLAHAQTSIHARDLVAAACGDDAADARQCRLMLLAPVNDALTFDQALLEAMIETGERRQGVVIAPTLLLGANAPATRDGALVRFAAEAMAGVALAQALHPGQPVAIGATVSDVSMRNGLPLVGTAHATAVMAGAIGLARYWQLAFFACGPATNAKGFDALGTAETSRWLTAAYHLGANVIVGAIGAVDLDDGVSAEKLLLDADIATALDWTSTSSADPAAGLRAAGPGGLFLATTGAQLRARIPSNARLADNQLYESWTAAGSVPLDGRIGALINQPVSAPPTVPPAQPVALLDRRPTLLADLASSIYSRSIRDAFGFGSRHDKGATSG